jgi:hypothetical protein
MKDTKDMNLEELADKVFNLEYCVNGCVREISDRLRELHELTRWIPVEERMPTEEDLHSDGTFRIWLNGGDGLACIHHNKIYVWDNDGFVDYDETNFRVAFTHWQRITPPEGA